MATSNQINRTTRHCYLPVTILLLALAFGSLWSGPSLCLGQQTSDAIEFSSPLYFGDEDTGSVTITVTRSGSGNRAVTVDYATGKGLATAGIDYTPQSGTLSFATGETRKTFSIPLLDDPFAEGSETVQLALTKPTGGAVLGNQATARMYIMDNEHRGSLLDNAFNGATLPTDFVSSIVLQPDGKVLAGGAFAQPNSTNRIRIIRLNADGSRDASFTTVDRGPDGRVHAVALQPDGKIVIGGEFTHVGSADRARIARLNSDGSLDTSFDPGSGVTGSVSPGVYTLVLQKDGKILIGGNFDSVNGVIRKTLARMNANGSIDVGFNSGGGISSFDMNFLAPWISGIALQTDGKVLISGQFTDVDGLTRINVARINADGSGDVSFNPGAGVTGDVASVETIALQPDGKVIIGGDFTTVDDLGRSGIARLNANGSIDLSFDPSTGVKDRSDAGVTTAGLVTSLAVQSDGRILLSGTFLTVDEINRHGIARLNRDGSLDGTFGPYFGTTYRNELGYEETESVAAMALQLDGKILIGATFVSPDGTQTNRLTRLVSTNIRTSSFEFSSPTTSATETNGVVSVKVSRLGDSVEAFTVDYGVGGGTATPGADYAPKSGTFRFGPQEVEKTITISIFDDPIAEDDETINLSLFNVSAGALLGSPTNHTVRIIDNQKPGNLDFGFAEISIPLPPGNLPPVTAIAIQKDGKVLVAGNFASVNATGHPGIVRLNPNGSIDPSFVPQAPAGAQILQFLQMGLQPDGKIVGGFNGVTRLNTDGSVDTRFAPDLGFVNSLTVQPDGSFFVSDEIFDSVNRVSLNEVVRFQADGSLDPGFGPTQIDDWATAMAGQPDRKVVIGGFFTLVNGVPQNRIARLNADGNVDTLFNTGSGIQGTNSAVYALAIQPDKKVIVGGEFTSVNNVSRTNLVRLNGDGSVDTSFGRGAGPNGFVESIAVQADGKVLIGGGFTSVDGVPRIGLARLNSDGSLDTGYNPKLTFSDIISLSSIAIQPDGKILIGGFFTAVNGATRGGVARLNGDASSLKLFPAARSPGSPFRMTLTSQPGKQYRIDVSIDLVNWSPVKTISATGLSLEFEDTSTTSAGARFYRAVLAGP